MWPFNKTLKTPDKLPIDGPWSVGQGQHNGQVLIVRSNSGYRDFAPIASYDHQVGIAVPMRDPDANGLPSTKEDSELGDVEDALCGSLESDDSTLLVAVITTGGMREFVFYTRKPKEVETAFESLRKSITSHEIQLMIQPDKRWNTYSQFQ
jgi:hypothetical protein